MANVYRDTQSLTADGQTTGTPHPGGSAAFYGVGTFGSGTLTMEVSFDGGTTWVDVLDSAMTADDVYAFVLPPCLVRGDLSGATNPSITVGYEPVGDL